MQTVIQSNQNKIYKHIKSLSTKKNRYKNRQFIIEGERFVKYAFDNGFTIDYICVSECFDILDFEMLREEVQNCQEIVVTFCDSLFKELIETENSQGIFAVVQMPEALEASELLEKYENDENIKQFLFLDRIQDPGNLGTIIRTADACGIQHILLNKGTVDPYNGKVVRSTAGSILNVKLIEVSDDLSTLKSLATAGVRLLVTSLDADYVFNDREAYGQRNCLIIGNEANGVSETIQALDCKRIIIPIVGKAESLNASVAAGIMMYKIYEYCIQK